MSQDSFLIGRMRALTFKRKAWIVLAFFSVPLLLFVTLDTARYLKDSQTLSDEVIGVKRLRPLLLEQLKVAGLSEGTELISERRWELQSAELLRMEQDAYRIGDESGLILDTELHTLYLSLIVAQVMPRLISASAQLKAMQRGISSENGYAYWMSVALAQLDMLDSYTRKANETLGFTHVDVGDAIPLRQNLAALKFPAGLQGPSGQAALVGVNKYLQAKVILVAGTLEIALAKRQRELLSRNLWLAFLVGLSITTCIACFYVFYEGTVRDIEHQRKIDSELRHAKVNAERLSQAKSEFLSNMSHEIRTPMNGVMGMLELARESIDAQEQQRYLATAQNSASALLKILNEILDYSKLEAHHMQMENRSWDVHGLLDELKVVYSNLCLKKQLDFALHLDSQIPRYVMGDALRTRQILTNLLENAIKFTEHGYVHLDVREGADSKGLNTMVFEVRDTGIGVPLGKQATVFNAFEQADASTTRRFGGTGLGLAISAELARLMGGEMSLRSSSGEGSVFRLEIPMLPAVDATRQHSSLIAESPGSLLKSGAVDLPLVNRPLQVLLVEDHKVNQILAKTLLHRWGHNVSVAENGKEAIDIFPSKRWDLVLMDLQMPVMGGKEATRLIRQAETAARRTPIIALSASALLEDLDECRDAGMDDYLAKPFSALSLAKIIHKHVS